MHCLFYAAVMHVVDRDRIQWQRGHVGTACCAEIWAGWQGHGSHLFSFPCEGIWAVSLETSVDAGAEDLWDVRWYLDRFELIAVMMDISLPHLQIVGTTGTTLVMMRGKVKKLDRSNNRRRC